MCEFYLKGLDRWKSSYNGLYVIPWTLIMRRAENLKFSIHINTNMEYRHPVYNDFDLIKKYCDDDFIKCLSIPFNILNDFYIDSDLHPSTLGYMFLTKCIERKSPFKSIYLSIYHLNKCIRKFFSKMKIDNKIFISGESIAIPTLSKILPVDLCFSDLISLSSEPQSGRIHIKLMATNAIIEINQKQNEESDEVILFPWDYLGFNSISKRHPDLNRFKPDELELSNVRYVDYFNFFDSDELFDIGEKLTPTLKGFLFILSLASNLPHDRK